MSVDRGEQIAKRASGVFEIEGENDGRIIYTHRKTGERVVSSDHDRIEELMIEAGAISPRDGRMRPRREDRRKRKPTITHVRNDPPPQQKNRGKRSRA